MRVLLLVLAIVLLPLRGWVGDAMMLAPVQQASHAAAGHTMHAMTMSSAGTADAHAMHATHSPEALAGTDIDRTTMHGDADSPHPHANCDTCQFCHSVAMTAWPEVPMPAQAPRHATVAEAVVFASAEAAQGFKPPIS